jgi:hypothetical protein
MFPLSTVWVRVPDVGAGSRVLGGRGSTEWKAGQKDEGTVLQLPAASRTFFDSGLSGLDSRSVGLRSCHQNGGSNSPRKVQQCKSGMLGSCGGPTHQPQLWQTASNVPNPAAMYLWLCPHAEVTCENHGPHPRWEACCQSERRSVDRIFSQWLRSGSLGNHCNLCCPLRSCAATVNPKMNGWFEHPPSTSFEGCVPRLQLGCLRRPRGAGAARSMAGWVRSGKECVRYFGTSQVQVLSRQAWKSRVDE